jgi:hypothetical protein
MGLQPRMVANAATSWATSFFGIIRDYLYRTLSLLWVAPVVAGLVIIPEFVQHLAEISLGMFDSRAAAKLVADHPLRMGIGAVKIAGLVVTFFASARFWWCSVHGGHWYDPRGIAWGRLLVGVVLFFVIGSAAEVYALMLDRDPPVSVAVITVLLSLPFLFVALAGLFGAKKVALAVLVKRSWPYLLLLLLLLPLGFVTLSYLHQYNHKWAMGAAAPVIWALMIFDSLVVGLLASSVGAAFYTAYARFHERFASGAA